MAGYYAVDPKRSAKEIAAEQKVLWAAINVLSGAATVTEAAKQYRLDLEKLEEVVLRIRVCAVNPPKRKAAQ